MEPSKPGTWIWRNALDDAIRQGDARLALGLIERIRNTPQAWQWARFGYPAERLHHLGPVIRRAAVRNGITIPAGYMGDEWFVSDADIPLDRCWFADILTPELMWQPAPELIKGDDQRTGAALH